MHRGRAIRACSKDTTLLLYTRERFRRMPKLIKVAASVHANTDTHASGKCSQCSWAVLTITQRGMQQLL